MWVRTTLTIKRWTEEKTGCKTDIWEENQSNDISRLPSWKRGRVAGIESSGDGDMSSFSSEGDRCCWKHQQCAGHIIHPFSDCGHHNRQIHTISPCDCEFRLKDCSEKTKNGSSRDVGPTCSRDEGSNCFNIIHAPCFELIPEEEECVDRIWYSWCESYKPISVAVIHHPIYPDCRANDLNEDEDYEETLLPTPTQLCPVPTNPDIRSVATPPNQDTGSVSGVPDSAAPITIWRSESPTKCHESKVIQKIKKKEKEKEKEKKKEKDKEDEMVDEKVEVKKKTKKGKLIKKKCPVKSESSPPDLSTSLSPRDLARTSESSPESREELGSEDSYDRVKEGPSSEEIVEASSSPRKREKSTAKKSGTKTLQTRKITKRKSPPAFNPNLS
ncbi:protein PROCA1 isoform X2 [Psammomys obesus]|uniref:protein PROCA1 isoform X2 n=1 Tax=Psammomys obesus TaxID=48139 RepID=UPI002452F9A6|nr:protein PROCA1 isoform X2 [Psammomys obesus]